MKRIALLIAIFVLITACAIGGEASEDANQPDEATQAPPSETPVPPTETPVPPTATPEPTATFTETPVPTEVPTDTPTFTPTTPPTETPVPGPITFTDDFSENNGNWDNCTVCEWTNGKLWYGPIPTTGTVDAYATYCTRCGTPTYFKMYVDVTYAEGPTDRAFGILFGDTGQEYFGWGITTWQVYWAYKLERQFNSYLEFQGEWSGMAKPGTALNNIGVEVIPTDPGYANIFLKLNGKTALIWYNKPVEPGQVGLMLDWHSIGVSYDNFEFEEIWPDWHE